MRLSRVLIRNFRNLKSVDVAVQAGTSCLVGENNSGKSNFLRAIRLASDGRLEASARQLVFEDFAGGLDPSQPQEIRVVLEFVEFLEQDAACALLGQWQVEAGMARLVYRFRPRLQVREDIESGARPPTGITVDEYRWELLGGGPGDPAVASWNEDLGSISVRFQDLQDLNVFLLPPLRDVEQAMRRSATSPLARLVDGLDLSEESKRKLVETVAAANEQVENEPSIRTLGESIEGRISDTTGPAFDVGLTIGVAAPTFASLVRSLVLLLAEGPQGEHDLSRSGLGLNNVVFISLLIEEFRRRSQKGDVVGDLLLFEEPEAHLHPELQHTLLDAVERSGIQTLVTSHSTHVSSRAPLRSYLAFTRVSRGESVVTAPGSAATLTAAEVADIERYLDATRSRLLYARRVLLVEGSAEQLLLPAMVRSAMGMDLDREGIAVVPIQGRHFSAYAKLFGERTLPRRCAILADGDIPEDVRLREDEALPAGEHDLGALESNFVRVFACRTTFERAITCQDSLPIIIHATEEMGAVAALAAARRAEEHFRDVSSTAASQAAAMHRLREAVLNVAKSRSKGRFAQVLARHAHRAPFVPEYARRAIEYLVS
jgi:putative ATP-dependent endonuclease of OLD family